MTSDVYKPPPPQQQQPPDDGASTRKSARIENKTKRNKRKLPIKNEQLMYYNEEEITYHDTLDAKVQHDIAAIENKMLHMNNYLIPLRFQVLQSGLDEKTMAVAIQKIEHLYKLEPSSSEHHKMLHWVETICKIPFGKYQPLPITKKSSVHEIKAFIGNIKETMDSKVFGHASAKDHIVRLLAQWISNPVSKGLVIGIQGSMGTGKTTLVKDAICKVLGLPFALVSLGGVGDGAFLVGHSETYTDAKWGHIVDILIKCGCMNPIIFFDELDKVSTTRHGEEITNILIHMTDSTQNDCFQDKFFTNIDFDLSRSLVIFSYNNEENINPILRDRMIKIKTDGYKMSDKIAIAKNHLIPGILSEFGYGHGDIVFDSDIIKQIVFKVDEEEGVRNLKRALHDVVSNLNLVQLLSPIIAEELSADVVIKAITKVTEKHVEMYVNTSKKGNTSHMAMYV